MAAKDGNNGDGLQTNERQRFYIELDPDDTTIVSWRKLLKQAATEKKDQSFHNSTTPQENPRKSDENYDGGHYKDHVRRNKRVKAINKATSLGYMQSNKRRADSKLMKGQKNGHTSMKQEGPESMSAKASVRTTSTLDEACRPSSPPALIKDHPTEEPLITLSKKNSSSINKSKCPPVSNAVENASVFPLKTTPNPNVLQNTNNISSEKRKLKVGAGGGSSNFTHQNSKGKCVPVDCNPTSGMLVHDKVSSKNQHNGNHDGSRELVGAIGSGYKSVKDLKDVSAAIDDTTVVRSFSQVLQGAIQELKDIVTKSKALHCEAMDAHASWLIIERKLPPEVKSKLDKIASIVQSGQGTASEELIKCLVSILGKLVHGKMLKRSWRKVVMLKLFMPKDKAEKFELIKNELFAKVSKQQYEAATPEAKETQISLETYKLDDSVEDKLCDLYDIFYRDLAADKYVQVQKMFFEIVDLWPKGVMDHNKLKEAINRAKSRRLKAKTNQCQNALDNVKKNPDQLAHQKSPKSLSSNKSNTIPLPRKIDPKKSTQQPVPQQKSYPSGVKLTFKQATPEKKNVKVKFLLKQERETLKSSEKSAKDT